VDGAALDWYDDENPMRCKKCDSALNLDGACPKCGPSINCPEMEYHFKCENCGADLGFGKSDAKGIKSLNVVGGSILDDPPVYDKIPVPRLNIECTLEFSDGTGIPLHPMVDKGDPEVVESLTFSGTCTICGTAFVRQLRQKQ